MFTVLNIKSGHLADGRGLYSVSGYLMLGHSFASCTGSLTLAILKCSHNNFEQKEFSGMKLFWIECPEGWIVPPCVLGFSAKGVIILLSDLATVLYCFWLQSRSVLNNISLWGLTVHIGQHVSEFWFPPPFSPLFSSILWLSSDSSP